jgi:hypothetical protein
MYKGADFFFLTLCQVNQDFKDMCGPDGFGFAGKTGYSVEHGYFGSKEPANIHGAFCNG